MPVSAPKPCRRAGCRTLVAGRDGFCDAHKAEQRRDVDSRRGSSTKRGYGSRWQKARATFLQRNPLCVKHCERGLVVAATVVDHVVPHKGDQQIFWDTANWQALCKECHDIKTAKEDGGFGKGRAG